MLDMDCFASYRNVVDNSLANIGQDKIISGCNLDSALLIPPPPPPPHKIVQCFFSLFYSFPPLISVSDNLTCAIIYDTCTCDDYH